MTTQTTALQKAHSAAQHLARMKKAVDDFHGKMTAMHKANFEKTMALHKVHGDDMNAAMGSLHKILGVEQVSGDYSSEPQNDSLGGGTHNLQDFGGGSGVGKAAPRETLTKADVAATVSDALAAAFGELFKALGAEDQAPAASTVPGGSQVEKFIQKSASNSAGIGDRNNLAPAAVTVIPVTKAADNGGPQATTTSVKVDGETVSKAMNGDIEAVRALMKGAEPAPIPTVLLDSLSKIH